MPVTNRIPLSVRIDQEDADFIAALQIDGAGTPSEKVRELLKQARLAHMQQQDYPQALAHMERFLQNARQRILLSEKSLGMHSPLLARLHELLPDLAAAAAGLEEEADAAALREYECEMMQRIARLAESVLQLAVMGKGAAYDDQVLQQLDNTLKLAWLVKQADGQVPV